MDLNDTVKGMLKMLRHLIGEDIDLKWNPDAGLWPINMDPTQIDPNFFGYWSIQFSGPAGPGAYMTPGVAGSFQATGSPQPSTGHGSAAPMSLTFDPLPLEVQQFDYQVNLEPGDYEWVLVVWLPDEILGIKELGAYYLDPQQALPTPISIPEGEMLQSIDIIADYANVHNENPFFKRRVFR